MIETLITFYLGGLFALCGFSLAADNLLAVDSKIAVFAITIWPITIVIMLIGRPNVK